MEKIRVYELAKQLNVSTKDLMNKLKENKIEVKSHMSTLDKDQISKVKSFFRIIILFIRFCMWFIF